MIAYQFDAKGVHLRRVTALANGLGGTVTTTQTIRSDGSLGVKRLVIEVPDDVTVSQVQAIVDTATGISEQAQQLWEKQQLRLKAKAAAQANNDATLILVRNTQKVVYQSLVEVRSAFNQLLQDIKDGKTPTGSALQNKTWQQAMNTVEQLVDLDPL